MPNLVPRRLRRARLPMLIIGVVALTIGALHATAQAVPNAANPLSDPVPRPEYVDDARSFVAAIDFQSAQSGTSAGVVVSNVATPGTAFLKPDLTVSSIADGAVVRSTTMPNPALAYAENVGFTSQAGRAYVLVPYDSRVEQLQLAGPAGATVATVDTTQAVHDYCVANPNDPDCRESDLSVDAVAAPGPLFGVLGRPVTITVASTVANAGPDGPTEAKVERKVLAGPGITVTPDAPATTPATLAVGTPQRLEKAYTVTCLQPGPRTLDFTTAVTPRRASVVDARADNNRRTARLTLDCAVPVTINIHPGSAPNPVNLHAANVPTAVLTTRAGEYGNPLAFDATTIVVSATRFGSPDLLLRGLGVTEKHDKIHKEDSVERDERTHDRDLDAVLHFGPAGDAFTPTDTMGCVFGKFTSGPSAQTSFYGCDTVTIVG
ncbi:hypothetical protein DFJ67_5678 [Asanoa ferruginea]|uniref:Repeat protein (TIGR01451 family) n=1 Tax=Asanoa ferruginea TaxID=53367 RepID=A0A3D9ZQK0_9ACTN|nr:hypothetical protein [Asanoa ferruginea]REF99638.1 hypothetical protein DFJ67_5678 [Asanoa ferruginea]GIF52105.1 hypothetical protein Afe04nite_66440 [Asanoa ferruginea]